jgi:hypothetical protein
VSISNYAEAKILNCLFNNTAFGAVANTYVKLHIGDPGEDCTGNPAAHTTRVEATWAAAVGGTITTDAAVTFTSLTAAETISHISVWDHLTAGNPLWYGALAANKAVGVGDTLNFPAGDIDITLD